MMLWRCILCLAVLGHIAMATAVNQANNGGVDIDDMFREFRKEIDNLKAVVRDQDARIIALERRLEVAEAIIRDDKGQLSRADEQEHGLPVLTSPGTSNATDSRGLVKDAAKRTVPNDDAAHTEGSLNRGIRGGVPVAFTAYLDWGFQNLGPATTIKYTHTYLNSGLAYNTASGIFTVPSSGIYFFYISIDSFHSPRTILRLMVDGQSNIHIITDPESPHSSMGGNSVLLQLMAGQTVWVETDNTTTGGNAFGGPFSTFTGFSIK